MEPLSRRRFLKHMTAAGGATWIGAQARQADGQSPALQGKYAVTKPQKMAPPAEAAMEEYETLVREPVLQMGLMPHWLAGGQRFWYQKDGPEGTTEFLMVECVSGRKQDAFDHVKLAAALTHATGQPCRADALPLSLLQLADDGQSLQFMAGGAAWHCTLADYSLSRLPEGTLTSPAALGKHGAEAPKEEPRDPMLSPDKQWTASVKDHNLFVQSPGGAARQITQTGTADAPFGEVRWSPDSQRLVAFRVRAVQDKPVYLVESSPKDGGFRGVLHQHDYAQPGDPFTTYEPWACDPTAGTAIPVQTELLDFGDLPEMHWTHDSRRFLYEKTERGHQRFRVLSVDTRTGLSRAIIDERAQTFINTSHSFTHITEGAAEIIHASEQDGWRHLYLYDAETGRLKNQITHGAWVVRDVVRVDEKNRHIYLTGSGKNAGEDPYHLHHYRVNFDGTGLTELTDGNGQHSVQYSPDNAYLVDTFSRPDAAPVHTLRRVSDGALVTPLETADSSALTAKGWRAPLVFQAKGRDGKTDIWGLVFRPTHLNPTQKYPVIENIYAGPHDSFVRKTFAVRDAMQSLAELGFIVVQCDGMGTRNRSKAFHDVCWRNVADAGLPDRIAWIKALGAKYPYIDTTRVGIYGTSAGGQSSTGALLFHPDFYQVAVSSCGCHDNRVDKRWWNEQWMGYPVGPWYGENSNITHAAKLRGKLLLMVGELDTNVPPESTLRLADALIKADKDFDLLVLPGLDHTGGGTYGEWRRRDFFRRHLRGEETPDRNAPRPPVTPVRLTAHPASAEYLARGDAGEGTTIAFHNGTAQAVRLFWLPGDGSRAPYGTLAPGETHTQNTYAGHTWLVVGADGMPLAIFVAEGKPGLAEITQSP